MFLKIITNPCKKDGVFNPKINERIIECKDYSVLIYEQTIEIHVDSGDNFTFYREDGKIADYEYIGIFSMNNDGKTIDSHSWYKDE